MNRTFDIILFGATGYTGICVFKQFLKRISNQKLKFAIAGRDKSKLDKLISESNTENIDIGVIISDVHDKDSLKKMTESCEVLVNVVGPYRFYGEAVIESCLLTNTHYVDITGEPLFMEQMFQKYHKEMKEKHLVCVSSCGFDSIPSDIGALYMRKQFQPNSLYSVEIYHQLNGSSLHSTTWDCVVHSISDFSSLKLVRKDQKKLNYHTPRYPVPNIHYNDEMNEYSIKFPGSDASVVNRSQQFKSLDETYVSHYTGVYMTLHSYFNCLLAYVYMALIYFISLFSLGKRLMIDYPQIFTFGVSTKAGPSKADLESGELNTIIIGKGYSNPSLKKIDKTIIVKLTGPNAGYICTSIFAVESALTILSGECKEYGVLTPAIAFENTHFIEKLDDEGIHFSTTFTNH